MASRTRQAAFLALSHLQLDASTERTLRRSLYMCVLDAITRGELLPGTRLPSMRVVAANLKISRNTVSDAFAQLVAEEYLVSRGGSGMYVTDSDVRLHRAPGSQPIWERASKRGRLLALRSSADTSKGHPTVPFQPGIPSFENFPYDVWSRLAARTYREATPELLGYGESAGYGPLRRAIAAQIRSRGGEPVSEEQIVVVGGTSQALDIVARLALDSGDEVWLENPSSLFARGSLASAGATIIPVDVDDEGLNVRLGIARSPRARLAYVTSAHQWPLGATLSENRRAELLTWANDTDAWIVEDEYDGIFRYDGSKPTSLRSSGGSERVISVGSFSVTMFPSMRIGYVDAPPSLAEAFVAAKATIDRQASPFEQAMLADFIYDGHFAKYRKRMEAVYARRQEMLIERLSSGGCTGIEPTTAGLHVIVPLPDGADDRALSAMAMARGISAPALSDHYLTADARKGLIIGFSAGTATAMHVAAGRLCEDILKLT